jgi:NarL family two-component system response regulator LiaR
MVNRPVRVLIVDDYAVVRHGLQAVLATAPDVVVVGEAADGATAVRLAADLQPDVIIMDLVLPRLNGIEAIKIIGQENPHIRILVLTNFGDEPHILAALKAGAQGYLLKDAVVTDVVAAIRVVYAGNPVLHPGVTAVLMRAWQETKTGGTAVPDNPALTHRELDVLKLVAAGLGNRAIAHQLEIDEKTVRLHVSHMLQKLTLTNRTQLALYALRQGLASLNDDRLRHLF